MNHRFGPSPDPARSLACIVTCALLLGARVAAAEAGNPLTLTEAEDLALAEEPGRLSLLSRAAAFAEEAVAAGQLPDPTVRVGLANYPLPSASFTAEPMTQAQLGIRQAFPPGETRAASTRQLESMAEEMRDSAEGREREVLAAVRQAWFEAFYWQRAEDIVRQSRPLFADLATVTRSMYSVGRRDQQDLLRAELELSRLDDRLIDIGRMRARSVADLSQWVGDAARRPIAEVLPAWQRVPPLEELRSNLDLHPLVDAAEARIDASEAGVDLAEERFKPGWALDFGYGYRGGTAATGGPRDDFVSLTVTMDLPVFHKNRQDRRLAAALRQRRAASDSKAELMRRLSSSLEAEYSRFTELDRRIAHFESEIVTLSGNYAGAALSAYQSDTADFADVMRAYIDDLDTRVQLIRLRVERAQSYAALANLGGIAR